MNYLSIYNLFLSTIFVTILHLGQTVGEVFTAIADLEELLDTETYFLSNLESFIKSQDERIEFLKRRLMGIRKEHQLAETDPVGYVSNPINAFLLTKRLTSDWKSIEKIVTKDFGSEYMGRIGALEKFVRLPTHEDLNGTAVALVRLQETYNLDTTAVARGELNGIQYSTKMTSNDCYEIGRKLFENGHYYYTTLWMKEALDRMTTDADENYWSTSKSDILEYLSNSSYHEGNIAAALKYTNEILDISPDHEKAKNNKIIYENSLKSNIEGKSENQHILPNKKPKTNVTRSYEMLCRKEIQLPPAKLSKLKCKYVTNRSSFLKIAPLKLEEVCLEPYIVVYHDVMYDAEIDLIKKLAKPKLQRARVGNGDKRTTADFRICKSAFLKDDEHKFIRDISARIEDMTGLTPSANDHLQVANYGIGGHYTPHLDYGINPPLVTVLFYMSDVTQGGATVFPELNLAIWPKKGSAAFWYNFLTSGEGDKSTLHAACPVLVGSKWVSNKWISIRHQTFSHQYRLWKER